MKKLFLLLFLACSSLFVSAQKCSQIDFDEIYKKNNDKKSNLSISKLLERYQALDTTMTPEEYKYLYYGYTRTTFYSPIDPETTMLRGLVENGKLEEAKESIKKIEKTHPVNLNPAYSKLLIAIKEREFVKIKVCAHQMKGLFQAIIKSGDGKSEEKAFVVTSIEDEYLTMKILEIDPYQNGAREKTKSCDIFKLNIPNEFGNAPKIYFNKEKSSEYLQKMFGEKK